METIGNQKIWTFVSETEKPQALTNTQIRKSKAIVINDYMDLATKAAELQFLNREHVLLFRGQDRDYKNRQSNSTLKPTLFRPSGKENPDQIELQNRFDTLERAERELVEEYENAQFLGVDRLKRQRILRWSLLQHYEVCPTPLLDVTHSLRIASSFAADNAEAEGEAYIFVLGIPNLSGAITASAEAGLQIVRLSSVCPPAAVRPHIQEGYLLGEYPEMTGYDQKQHYGHFEIDFGLRLVAKFRFVPSTFWNNIDFPRVKHGALYPNDIDPLFDLAKKIKRRLDHRY